MACTSLAARVAVPLVLLTAATGCSRDTESEPRPQPRLTAGTRELHVAPTGRDSNPGTSGAPFRQVSRAARVAAPGTVVRVAPGVYGAVTSAVSGTPRAPVTFVSDTKWGARIRAPGSTNAWTNTAQWVVIKGFDIAGATHAGIMSTASNGRFLGNHIHDLVPPDCSRGGAGIELQSYTARNNDAIGNVVHDILVAGDCPRIHGIYYQSPGAGRILNNLVYRTSGWGIHLWHNANSITISHNTVFQNRQGGMVIGGSLEGDDHPPGIASGVVVTNNIVVDNGDWGILELGRVGLNTYANNLLYGNAGGGYRLLGGARPTGTVTADPQFVDYRAVGGGDYRLRSTSPALDKAGPLGTLGYDLDLALRPEGPAADLGAYEGGH